MICKKFANPVSTIKMQKRTGKIAAFILCFFVVNILAAQRRANFIELGGMELNAGHYAKAIENLNIGLKLIPDSYEGYSMRAFAKFQLDDFAGAEEDYTQSLKLFPAQAKIYFFRAITRDELYDFNGALDDFQKAIGLDSRQLRYLYPARQYLPDIATVQTGPAGL